MRVFLVSLLLALCFGAGLAQARPLATVTAAPGCLAQPPEAVVHLLAATTNTLRSRAGRPPLPIDQRLTASAQTYACDLARRQEISHIDRRGRTPMKRVRRAGYRACFSAENLAAGVTSPEAAVAAWQGSPAHSRNQLDQRAAAMGFGVARDAEGRLYWTALYARPCP